MPRLIEVAARGETVINDDKLSVQLVPHANKKRDRQFGSAKGLLSMAPDFDELSSAILYLILRNCGTINVKIDALHPIVEFYKESILLPKPARSSIMAALGQISSDVRTLSY